MPSCCLTYARFRWLVPLNLVKIWGRKPECGAIFLLYTLPQCQTTPSPRLRVGRRLFHMYGLIRIDSSGYYRAKIASFFCKGHLQSVLCISPEWRKRIRHRCISSANNAFPLEKRFSLEPEAKAGTITQQAWAFKLRVVVSSPGSGLVGWRWWATLNRVCLSSSSADY